MTSIILMEISDPATQLPTSHTLKRGVSQSSVFFIGLNIFPTGEQYRAAVQLLNYARKQTSTL